MCLCVCVCVCLKICPSLSLSSLRLPLAVPGRFILHVSACLCIKGVCARCLHMCVCVCVCVSESANRKPHTHTHTLTHTHHLPHRWWQSTFNRLVCATVVQSACSNEWIAQKQRERQREERQREESAVSSSRFVIQPGRQWCQQENVTVGRPVQHTHTHTHTHSHTPTHPACSDASFTHSCPLFQRKLLTQFVVFSSPPNFNTLKIAW